MANRKVTEICETVTNRIVAMLEANAAGDWSRPWTAAFSSPLNAKTGKAYQGFNILALSFSGYTSKYWATYKQWDSLGAQVSKGAKSTMGVYYGPYSYTDKVSGEDKTGKTLRVFFLFNAEQVTGWEEPEKPSHVLPTVDKAEEFFARQNVPTMHGGDRAFYVPAMDRIGMPDRNCFHTVAGYYSTLAHEHAHATGHKSRLDRDASTVFGSADYAAEELVAELSAAFLLPLLGLSSSEPRRDHAAYLASWLRKLKDDPMAIQKAASAAQKAVNYMMGAAEDEAEE